MLGEANFSDHGANRLGASALMQGLADGYFVLPATIAGYLAGQLGTRPSPTDHEVFDTAEAEVDDRIHRLMSTKGTHSVDHYHRELGKIVWDYCGMARNKAGLEKALSEIPATPRGVLVRRQDPRRRRRASTSRSRRRCGSPTSWRWPSSRSATRSHREESCGGHFREEHQTPEGEAQRDDENFAYVAAWEYGGPTSSATRC